MSLETKSMLIIFSGLPASGKTTLASKLATHLRATYIRMDAILLGLKEETKQPDLPDKCYRVARSFALENLRVGNIVICDSVNPTEELRKEWNDIAQSAGTPFIHFEIVCSNKEEHQMRLETRNTTLAGLTDPNWQEIQKLEYQSWDQDRVLIETGGKTIAANFEEIILALKSNRESFLS
jgi:predicted kinase